MSVNKFQPHVFVLPEDDANTQLANGFVLEVEHGRRIQILPEAGGWLNVCETFLSEHVRGMRRYPERHIVLLLDFDDQADRPLKVNERVPEDIRSRVFLLGSASAPEALRQAGLGSFEDIGRRLARECRDGIRDIWSHPLLQQNASEIERLEQTVRGFLF
jgi:hypothetical protein